ncbi:MAG: divergent PAP2 family protein [Clostridia bacterium]|nr:divergent PAP2 family protein [Clostridia bacterium]
MGDFVTNKWLWIPIITWFLVQIFKVIRELLRDKKVNFRRIWGAGGMPSAHTACVTSFATSMGLTEGFGSPLFAFSVVFAFIVMYDAAGVRRACGKQARVLNQIIESEGKNINIQEKLVEFLGHTPVEVFCGALTGILLGTVLVHLWNL